MAEANIYKFCITIKPLLVFQDVCRTLSGILIKLSIHTLECTKSRNKEHILTL